MQNTAVNAPITLEEIVMVMINIIIIYLFFIFIFKLLARLLPELYSTRSNYYY